MSEVAYNEEVTATTLNNIAVDLGQVSFSYFENEVPYAVSQLNKITADLVSSGVLRTGENGALGCEVTVSDGRAYIAEGIIVFESGAKLRITTPVGINIAAGTGLYAVYDSTTGNASIVVSDTEPTSDYVLLAEVDAEGVLADRRSGCVAKTTLPADVQNVYKEVTVTHDWKNGAAEVVAVDVGTSAFSYVFIKPCDVKFSSGQTLYTRVPAFQNAFCLADGEKTRLYIGKTINDSTDTLYITKEGQYIYVDFSLCTKNYIYTINLVAM